MFLFFPHSIVHPFYEQYLTMWPDTFKSISYSILAIFVVTFLFLGLDIYSAVIVVITICMIIVNLMGLMYWWNISLNAVSLVNLVVVSNSINTLLQNNFLFIDKIMLFCSF